MKVILTEEVVGLGEPGKVVDVAPGYARNFLVPRKLAVYANTSNVRELEHNKARLERKRQRMAVAARSVADKISAQVVNIEAHSGKVGKLYGSITSLDIANALLQQFEVTVDRRRIHLPEPIRTLGEHIVDVHLMGETHAAVKVNVFDPTLPVEVPVVQKPADETEA